LLDTFKKSLSVVDVFFGFGGEPDGQIWFELDIFESFLISCCRGHAGSGSGSVLSVTLLTHNILGSLKLS